MRSTLIYLLLVGTPLLGLLAILTAGEQLVPPHAIGGRWIVQGANGSPCVLTLGVDGTAEMNVSQSGPRAEATFSGDPAALLSLRLDGDSISGSGSLPRRDGCTGETLALNGKLRMTDSATTIAGTLARAGCATCDALDFIATHVAAGER